MNAVTTSETIVAISLRMPEQELSDLLEELKALFSRLDPERNEFPALHALNRCLDPGDS